MQKLSIQQKFTLLQSAAKAFFDQKEEKKFLTKIYKKKLEQKKAEEWQTDTRTAESLLNNL